MSRRVSTEENVLLGMFILGVTNVPKAAYENVKNGKAGWDSLVKKGIIFSEQATKTMRLWRINHRVCKPLYPHLYEPYRRTNESKQCQNENAIQC